MRLCKYISAVLVCAMLLSAFVIPMTAIADDTVPIETDEFKKINTVQQYFFRVIGSLARADYYKTDVLASITLSQGIYEGGWGRYSLPVGGRNLFGIKAYSTWSGMVYDQKNSMLYDSYADYLLSAGQSHVNTTSAWRAHASWAESVATHSSLFINESKYAAVPGEKDYSVAAHAIVDAGYCNDDGYAETVIALIEQYNMTYYDDLTPDSDGIVAHVADEERVLLDIGDTHTVALSYYPSDKTPSEIKWESTNPSVATVDDKGNVTALAHGMTLVTATLANGREACSIIYVDCNATVIDSDVYVRTSPSASSENSGKIYRGTAIKVTDETVYTDSEGNKYYKVTGYNSKGVLVSGYSTAANIYLNKRNVTSIAVVKDDITLAVGDNYEVLTVVTPADAIDKELSWISSDETVATVDQSGVITAKAKGSATITARAAGGTERKITVTVASSQRIYAGLVSAYKTLSVREEMSNSSDRVGTLSFLTKVTVMGEPIGSWYKVSGPNSSGKTITGYVNSAYIRLIPDDFTATFGTAPANITVYAKADTSSVTYRTLAEGTDYAVIGKNGDWSYVVGLVTPSDLVAVHGYAQLDSQSTTPDNPPSTDIATGDVYYGRTASNLYIREGAGSSFDTLGQFALDTKVYIYGDAENGWYKVSGTDKDGDFEYGYSSAQYITLLYSGKTTSRLNLRDAASTSGNSLTILDNGAEITLVGEATDGWYKVEYGELVGYCSADYITVSGKLKAENAPAFPDDSDPGDDSDPDVDPDPEFAITDKNLSISSGILNGVYAETSVEELLAGFTGKVHITDASGNTLSSDELVGTGYKLYYTANGITTLKATVVVKGDVDGDGEISAYDYIYVKRHFMGTYTLSGNYLKSALLSGRDEVNIVDYVMIKRACMGTYVIK